MPEGHFISIFVDWETFRSNFGNTLGSSWGQKSSWRVYKIYVLIRCRFSRFLPDHFGGFWRPLGEVFGDILATFVVIDFIINLYMIFRWFFIDFDALWTSKIGQKAWRVVQKSTLHLICYRMSMDIDFGWILGSGWEQFWVPIGLQKWLRKQVV